MTTIEAGVSDRIGISRSFHDLYFLALLLALAAYAFLGKGFAYAGLPPVFIGEVLLLVGLLTLVLPFPSVAVLYSGPHLILALMMVWTLVRTIPYVGVYGIDALRDSVIVMYGLFAFITANLLLENVARIDQAVRYAARFATLFGAVAALLYIATSYLHAVIPVWPVSGSPMLALRGGEVAVHLGAAAVLAIVGLKHNSFLWICVLILSIAVISALSRGGMLAIAVPVFVALALSGQILPTLLTALAAIPLVFVLYITDLEITLPSIERTLAIRQMVDNVISIFGSSGQDGLDGTKIWRLRWWEDIFGYTFHGEYFWTGKGFGVNLAESDGFIGGHDDETPLRSPHNAHMTILARGGVPGLALWVLLNLSWFWTMLRCIVLSRLRGEGEWASLFIFVTCYLTGILVHSTFDVALEGPMMGIPFWVLFGAGVALAMTYQEHHRLLPSCPPSDSES